MGNVGKELELGMVDGFYLLALDFAQLNGMLHLDTLAYSPVEIIDNGCSCKDIQTVGPP